MSTTRLKLRHLPPDVTVAQVEEGLAKTFGLSAHNVVVESVLLGKLPNDSNPVPTWSCAFLKVLDRFEVVNVARRLHGSTWKSSEEESASKDDRDEFSNSPWRSNVPPPLLEVEIPIMEVTESTLNRIAKVPKKFSSVTSDAWKTDPLFVKYTNSLTPAASSSSTFKESTIPAVVPTTANASVIQHLLAQRERNSRVTAKSGDNKREASQRRRESNSNKDETKQQQPPRTGKQQQSKRTAEPKEKKKSNRKPPQPKQQSKRGAPQSSSSAAQQ